MDLKVIYEDDDLLIIDKPAGFVVFPEGNTKENTLIDSLLIKYPELKKAGEAPRHGIVHRLDKNTSGILIIAKTNEALIFLQKQFKNREVDKKYLALATGVIKEEQGTIKTLLSRSPADPRKQKAYPMEVGGEKAGAREAITEYRVLQRFLQYTFLEVHIATGRKHQIRAHLAHIHHPIAGDTMYGFKDSPFPKGLERQFLHASYLKLQLPNGETKEFSAPLPEDLRKVLEKINPVV